MSLSKHYLHQLETMNRSELQRNMIDAIVDGMDMEMLCTLACDALSTTYDEYSDSVLMEEVKVFPKDGVLYDVLTDKGPKGYAFIGTSRSKFDNFEYLALLDEDYSIVRVKVLVYRENYGGEVGSRKWLEQFIGLKEPINRV